MSEGAIFILGWKVPRWLRLTVGTIGCLLLIAVLGACMWLWMALPWGSR